MFICCSTWANSTSCWVNWLVSSGSSGFWFCSCVVKSCKKLWKLPAICCEASALAASADELDDDEEEDWGVVPETTGLALVAAPTAAMSLSSNPDVDAAARSEHPAI